MTFDQAFEKLIGHEGGYTAGEGDPGGETKYGISKRSYPHLDIKELMLAHAKSIYLEHFWEPAGCEHLPDSVRFQVFDMAVNSGVKAAIRMVQQTVGTNPDGVLGPITLQAIQGMDASRFIARLNGHRLAFMADLATWPRFGRGWARRIAKNLIDS